MYVIQSNNYCNVIVDTTRSTASMGPRTQIHNKRRKRTKTHTLARQEVFADLPPKYKLRSRFG